jgi:polysaccharide deacetylase 2 family uncharacterized protein YibQ
MLYSRVGIVVDAIATSHSNEAKLRALKEYVGLGIAPKA